VGIADAAGADEEGAIGFGGSRRHGAGWRAGDAGMEGRRGGSPEWERWGLGAEGGLKCALLDEGEDFFSG
jgi:hypothetical protein